MKKKKIETGREEERKRETERDSYTLSLLALRDIEILPAGSGAPKVLLHGHAKDVATTLGVSSVKVSISHSGEYAIAQAIVR